MPTTQHDLLEQMAKRLAATFQPADWGPLPLEGWANVRVCSDAPTTFGDLAHECLRQMRWQLRVVAEVTRQIGPEEKSVPPRIWEKWAHIIETGPLTIAPDDWQP